jgi:hypothetical protein
MPDLFNTIQGMEPVVGILKKISREDAEKMRLESKGYCTNITYKGAMEIAWKAIDENAKKVKYRYYKGKGIFIWSSWYEIG